MRRNTATGHVKKNPPERGTAAALGAVLLGPHKAPLVPPAIPAAQHERAGRARSWPGTTRPALPPASPGGAASGYGHLTRSRPQDSASNSRHAVGATQAVGRAQESPAEVGPPAGPEWGAELNWSLARPGPPESFNPSDQSRKRILHKKGPSAKPGPSVNRLTRLRLRAL